MQHCIKPVGSGTWLRTRILGLWAAAVSVLLPLSTAAAARCTTVAADCSISPGSLPSSSALCAIPHAGGTSGTVSGFTHAQQMQARHCLEGLLCIARCVLDNEHHPAWRSAAHLPLDRAWSAKIMRVWLPSLLWLPLSEVLPFSWTCPVSCWLLGPLPFEACAGAGCARLSA